MYSRSYTTGSNGEIRNEIPVESFTDPIIKEAFVKSFRSEREKAPEIPIKGEAERKESAEDDFEKKLEASVPAHVQKKDEKSAFSVFDGFLKNLRIEDLILAALIFLFLKDDNKDNDIIIPILLFIILAF